MPGVVNCTMTQKNILIVEDDADILELLNYTLVKEGYLVKTIKNGDEVLPYLSRSKPDAVLLDRMLPGTDGMEICRTIKSKQDLAGIPVLMLTAKSEESDIVSGLEIGADDYITKPFSPKVVVARLRTALRRGKEKAPDAKSMVTFGPIVIDKQKHEVTIDGKLVELTFSEFAILKLLCEKPGWVFSRGQIVDLIRGDNYAVSDRSIDVQIVGLRKKLGKVGALILTVRGVGYKLKT